jgi:CII-binding regulator of phage lambda lysogenization HflD
MIQINLELGQSERLVQLLETELSELKSEIRATDNWDYKEMLRRTMEEYQKTLSQLRRSIQSTGSETSTCVSSPA